MVVDNRQTRPYPEDYPEISGQDIPAGFEWRPSFTGEHLPPCTITPHSRNARNSATDLITSYGVASSTAGIRVNAGRPPLSPPPGRPPKPLPRLSLAGQGGDISRTKSEMALHVMPVSGFLMMMFGSFCMAAWMRVRFSCSENICAWLAGFECDYYGLEEHVALTLRARRKSYHDFKVMHWAVNVCTFRSHIKTNF